ncbi:hypothetical protein [Arthrobacter sp. S39]|uniref:hypothetical protein n=1 Tax=Arthrobacter sp. S39 TaxID=2509720 RepID=UPI001037172C|nr:hypothetical protein [Arthrobacter sp. S39]TAP41857.1 hypothetical protein EYS21_17135 [Arthrobacter sp. S39]
MPATHFDRFLAESVTPQRDSGTGLGRDGLYGLYTSWCLINNVEPEEPASLWKALKKHGIAAEHNNLNMTGPAAADYIISSAPDLV